MPTALVRAIAPGGRLLGPLFGQPPNLAELVRPRTTSPTGRPTRRRAAELGYAPRDLETGLRDTWAEARTGSPRLSRMATIAFARGVPAPECLAVEELADCARAAIERDGERVLSYGTGGGYGPLRELARRAARRRSGAAS